MSIEAKKQKLFEKTLSIDATDITYNRMLQINDILNFNTMYIQLINILASLATVADYGIGLTDFDLYHIDFDFELPSLDELLAGIHIKQILKSLEEVYSEFAKIELGIDYPIDQLLDYLRTLQQFFKADIWGGIGVPWIFDYGQPARYGITYYGTGYYYKFTLPEVRYVKLPLTLTSQQASGITQTIQQASLNPQVVAQWKVLLGNEQLAKAMTFRIDFLEKIMEKAMFLGFNIMGYSQFAPKAHKYGADGVEIQYSENIMLFLSSLDRALFGFILGITPLGVGRFTKENFTIFRSTAPRFAFYRALRIKRRFQSPISGLVFRRGWEAMRNHHKNPSIHKYATHRINIRMLRHRVKNRIAHLVQNAFDQNKYVMPVVDLVYRKRVGHKRSMSWKAKMSDEEFKKLWLEKWAAQGLNKDILNMLYGEYITWQKAVKKL